MARKRDSYAMWGGFVGGKLAMVTIDDRFLSRNFREAPAIFRTRKEARRQYQDVRRVFISEEL